MLVASTHDITHRRVAVSPLDAFLVLGLALAPLLMWALRMTTALGTAAAAQSRGGSHAHLPDEEEAGAEEPDGAVTARGFRGPPGRGTQPKAKTPANSIRGGRSPSPEGASNLRLSPAVRYP